MGRRRRARPSGRVRQGPRGPADETQGPHPAERRLRHGEGEPATAATSLLVTFDLVPSGSGTLLRFSETGYRELGWEAAVLEEMYADHVRGWDHFLPRLVTYAARVGAGR